MACIACGRVPAIGFPAQSQRICHGCLMRTAVADLDQTLAIPQPRGAWRATWVEQLMADSDSEHDDGASEILILDPESDGEATLVPSEGGTADNITNCSFESDLVEDFSIDGDFAGNGSASEGIGDVPVVGLDEFLDGVIEEAWVEFLCRRMSVVM